MMMKRDMFVDWVDDDGGPSGGEMCCRMSMDTDFRGRQAWI